MSFTNPIAAYYFILLNPLLFMFHRRTFINKEELLFFLLLTVWLSLHNFFFAQFPRFHWWIIFFRRHQISREISIHSIWKLGITFVYKKYGLFFFYIDLESFNSCNYLKEMPLSSFMYRRIKSAFQQQLSLLPLEGGLRLLAPSENVRPAVSFVFNFRGWNQPHSQYSFCDIKYFHLLVQGKIIECM